MMAANIRSGFSHVKLREQSARYQQSQSGNPSLRKFSFSDHALAKMNLRPRPYRQGIKNKLVTLPVVEWLVDPAKTQGF